MKKEKFDLGNLIICACGNLAKFQKIEKGEHSHDLYYKCPCCKGVIKIELPIPELK